MYKSLTASRNVQDPITLKPTK